MSLPMSKTTVSSLNPSFHLPEDVIIEILFRLPVKSLVRFIVVCKSWQALIENRSFISRHLNENPNLDFSYLIVSSTKNENNDYAMSLYTEKTLDTPISLNFPFLGEREDLFIIGVCNGLVCVKLDLYAFNLVICNPSTRRFSRIPDFDVLKPDCLENGDAAYGFAFDPCSDDYKVINITRYVDTELIEKAGVYTMSTNSWREIIIDVPIDEELRMRDYSPTPAFIDGIFYWECFKYPSDNAVLLSFNTLVESFKVITCPEGFNGVWTLSRWKSFQLNEELAIFAFMSERCFVVWTLNADSVSWNLKYAIGTLPVIAMPAVGVEEIGVIRLVGRGKNGDVIYEDRTSSNVQLFLYDLDSGEIKRLPFADIENCCQVLGYTESLIPVKKDEV